MPPSVSFLGPLVLGVSGELLHKLRCPTCDASFHTTSGAVAFCAVDGQPLVFID